MTQRPIIVKTGTETPDPVTGLEFPIPDCLNRLRTVADVVVTEDERETTILRAIRGSTILMTTYGDVTRRVLETGLPTLKAIVELGTGIDSLDIDAAKDLGVRVVNCPRYARNAVAECAFLLLIGERCPNGRFPICKQPLRGAPKNGRSWPKAAV